MRNKYGARKVKAPDGQVFDSQKEYHRYFELKLLERAGKISDLQRQVKFVLIPSQKDRSGKVIERECSYNADFSYFDIDLGEKVVEDVKGYRDPASAGYAKFVIKRKLMLWIHGIRIQEV
jgi:hypothetical protein